MMRIVSEFFLFAVKVTIEWLAFLFRIRKVRGSNIGPETGYPD
jgi:hypothetical protein